jgi:hypothetical protein
MRTIRTKVYTFNELNETAKERAIENYRNSNTDFFWADENRQSMEKFAEIFPIKVTDWSYGGRGEGVYFRFETDHSEIEELSGQRLANYLWNNYKGEIYSKKYYSLKGLGLTNERLKHKRVISKQITNSCPNKGKWSNSYYSAITIEKYNCPLTGYCMDNELLDEIWKFMDKPDNRDFKELLQDCFDSWIKACNNDIEEQNSDEYIADYLAGNEYEFTQDGNRF